jgi:hypothetical protein
MVGRPGRGAISVGGGPPPQGQEPCGRAQAGCSREYRPCPPASLPRVSTPRRPRLCPRGPGARPCQKGSPGGPSHGPRRLAAGSSCTMGRRHAAPQMLWHVCCSQRPRQYASASYERGTHGKTPDFLTGRSPTLTASRAPTRSSLTTASAWKRTVGGIGRPRVCAVLRWITSAQLRPHTRAAPPHGPGQLMHVTGGTVQPVAKWHDERSAPPRGGG